MTNADDKLDDDYNEYDEFDEENESGLSGFSVLTIGLIMFGAFIAITWIAYHQGIKRGENGGGTPYVAADPEPVKIETADAGETVEDREVYDVFDGEESDASTVIAEGPEEPVDRSAEDPIASIAESEGMVSDTVQAAQDRIASLAEEDAEAFDNTSDDPGPVAATPPTQANATQPAATRAGARSGSHVVQVGAFRSNDEAMAQWARMQTRFGDYLSGKTYDVETADLGDRGVYHRLRVGPFASSDAAKTYCEGLKERGQDCLIKGL